VSFLDVPGFQIFEHNAFEELLINVSNERLEAALVDAKLRAMQEEYVREGISWVTVDTRVMIPRQTFPLVNE
jgi:myosin heavy subunit